MIFRYQRRHLMPRQRARVEEGSITLRDVPQDRRIQLMVSQPVQLRARRQLKQAHLRLRVPLPEFPHRRHHQIIQKRGQKSQAQRPPRLPILLAQLLRTRLRITHNLPRLRQKKTARLREINALPNAVKQRHPQLRLQHADLPAQRRLRHMQAFRRSRNAQILGGGDEVTKLVKFHPGSDHRPALCANRPLIRKAAIWRT